MSLEKLIEKRLNNLFKEEKKQDSGKDSYSYHFNMNLRSETPFQDMYSLIHSCAAESGLSTSILSINNDSAYCALFLNVAKNIADDKSLLGRMAAAADSVFHPVASRNVLVGYGIDKKNPTESINFEIDRYSRSEIKPFIVPFLSLAYKKIFNEEDKVDIFLQGYY